MRKRIVFVLLLTFMLLTMAACADDEFITERVEGSIIVHRNIQQMADWSTHIVRAEVLSSTVEPVNICLSRSRTRLEPLYFLHTVYRLRVIEAYKGAVEVGEVLLAMQMGGRAARRELVTSHYTPIADGDDIVIFLGCFASRGGGHLPMGIVSPVQGIFRAVPPESGSDSVLENVGDAYDLHLTLTLGDLERIAAANFMNVNVNAK